MRKILLAVGSIICLLALCFNVNAANPTYKYFNNVSGINNKLSDLLIQDTECADAENVYFDEASIIKRLGQLKLNAIAIADAKDDLIGLYDFHLSAASSFIVTVTTEGTVYKQDSLDGTWDDITPAAGELTDDRMVSFATYTITGGGTRLLIANGSNNLQQWDGVAANAAVLPDVSGGNVPAFQYITVFKNRLFGVETTNPNRLYYSALNEADDFSVGGDTIEVDNNDGDVITGFAVISYAGTDIYDKLVIFKTKSIYILDADDTTPANWVLAKINSKVGCISNWSIQNIDNFVLFMSYDGIYALENTTVKQISDRIDPTFRTLNKARLGNACSVLNRSYDQYWLSVSNGSSTTNNLIIVYDFVLNAWTKFTAINAASLAEVIDPTTQTYRVYSGDYSGFCHRQWIGTSDNGTAISAFYQSKRYTFGAIEWLKRIMYVYIYAYASGNWDLTVEWAKDGQTTYSTKLVALDPVGSTWGAMVWGVDAWGAEDITRSRFDLEKDMWCIRFKISNNNVDETFKIYGWSFNVQPLERDHYTVG